MCRENEFRVVVGRHRCEQSIESLPTDILHAQRQAYGIYGFSAKKRKTMDDTKGKNISTVTFFDAKIDDAERFVIHPLHSKRSHGACSCSCVMQDYSFSQRTTYVGSFSGSGEKCMKFPLFFCAHTYFMSSHKYAIDVSLTTTTTVTIIIIIIATQPLPSHPGMSASISQMALVHLLKSNTKAMGNSSRSIEQCVPLWSSPLPSMFGERSDGEVYGK